MLMVVALTVIAVIVAVIVSMTGGARVSVVVGVPRRLLPQCDREALQLSSAPAQIVARTVNYTARQPHVQMHVGTVFDEFSKLRRGTRDLESAIGRGNGLTQQVIDEKIAVVGTDFGSPDRLAGRPFADCARYSEVAHSGSSPAEMVEEKATVMENV
jgi:hypothetical protein